MARLASTGWFESGRLFGEVTSVNSTEERKKDVCEWDTDPKRANADSSVNRYVPETIDQDRRQILFVTSSYSARWKLIPRFHFQELVEKATDD